MKFSNELLIFALLAAFQLSCSVGPLTTLTGETAKIRLHDGTFETVEIIAVDDSSLLCLPAPGDRFRTTSQVKEVSTDTIAHIEVSGFRNNSWWIGVVFFEVLPAAGLAAAASSAGEDFGPVFAAALIPAAFTTLLYVASGVPTPTFEGPFSSEQMTELRKYARFGGTLTPSQKAQLLGMQQQAETK